jgi:hypothetical protein
MDRYAEVEELNEETDMVVWKLTSSSGLSIKSFCSTM